MEFLLDPTIWAGLATLIVMEIVLGIDNLIFIAILSDKLPAHQRRKARRIGLLLALGMRLILLAGISWIATLTAPLFTVIGNEISGRDIIMLLGGGFLLFKGTMELHEKLEGAEAGKSTAAGFPKFWHVIVQIIVLDAVFSLDAVITAIGMVDHLPVMMLAVCIAMALMILAANPLMNFVSAHPTVVILCLGFLLMIGFSLMVEGLGYHIPKGYLYAAIGFSVLIEALNQTALWKKKKHYGKIDPRTRLSQAVLGLLGAKSDSAMSRNDHTLFPETDRAAVFQPQERLMINRVLQLSDQSVGAIMTPRRDLYWIDLADEPDVLRQEIIECPYSCLILVEDGKPEDPLGFVHKKDLADLLLAGKKHSELRTILRRPIIMPDSMTVLQALELFRDKRIHVAFVVNEYGTLEGLVTLTDIAEAIAGDMPEDHEDDDFTWQRFEDGAILVSGSVASQDLQEILGPLALPEGDYNTIAGIALHVLKKVPQKGDHFHLGEWRATIESKDRNRIGAIRFSKN